MTLDAEAHCYGFENHHPSPLPLTTPSTPFGLPERGIHKLRFQLLLLSFSDASISLRVSGSPVELKA